ncbi:MAG: hypothetical protein ACJ0DD_00230 [Paracoccaceae bacterium]
MRRFINFIRIIFFIFCVFSFFGGLYTYSIGEAHYLAFWSCGEPMLCFVRGLYFYLFLIWMIREVYSVIKFFMKNERKPETNTQLKNKYKNAKNASSLENDSSKTIDSFVLSKKSPLTDQTIDSNIKEHNKKNTIKKDLLLDYPNAKIAIEYRQDANEGWGEIQKMPLELSVEYLKSLENDAKQDISSLIENINKKYYLSISPFDDEKLAKAYSELHIINHEASSEFEKAINTLGDSVPLEQIVEKIKSNFQNN